MTPSETGNRKVSVFLNQQQLELVDRTVAGGLAASREDLLRLALKEYAASRGGKSDG